MFDDHNDMKRENAESSRGPEKAAGFLISRKVKRRALKNTNIHSYYFHPPMLFNPSVSPSAHPIQGCKIIASEMKTRGQAEDKNSQMRAGHMGRFLYAVIAF